MDVLSEVLRAVRLTGAIFFELRFRSPWIGESPHASAIAGSVMPEAQHVINFHALISGSCWAELVGGSLPPMHLDAGDIIIYPMGDANVLSSSPGMRADPDLAIYHRPHDRQLPIVLRQDGGGTETCHIVCGYFGCDARPFNPVLEALPRMLRAPVSAVGRSWLAELLRLAAEEGGHGSPGGETMLARLAELVFIEVLRRHIESLTPDSPGWFSGLRDRHVGAALRLIHGQPTKAWTVVRLAKEVGLSKSTFTTRFSHYLGVSPMHYLAAWRMQLASRLLEEKGAIVAQVASEVGYESEAAFSRAFKKYVGVSPGIWRRESTPFSQ